MLDEKELISKVKNLITKYDLEDDDKNGFNIFSILRDESEEVMLHSRFIFELLNPMGSHNMKETYLSLFIETINSSDISLPQINSNCIDSVAVYRERQNIDILIFLPDDYTIIIENKIYSGDQEAQLERYFNIVVEEYKKTRDKVLILYLTLDRHKPSTGKGNLNHPVYCISYDLEIDNWLEKCILKSKTNILKETIKQYKSLICKLSNKYDEGKENMVNEISKLIISDVDTFKSANIICESINTSKSQIMMNFMKSIEKEINKNGYETNYFDSNGIDSYYTSKQTPSQRILLKRFKEDIDFCFSIEITDNLYYYFALWKEENGNYEIIHSGEIESNYKDIYDECLNGIIPIFGDIKRKTEYSIMWEYIYDSAMRKYDFKNFSNNCIELIKNTDKDASIITNNLLPLVKQVKDILNK